MVLNYPLEVIHMENGHWADGGIFPPLPIMFAEFFWQEGMSNLIASAGVVGIIMNWNESG